MPQLSPSSRIAEIASHDRRTRTARVVARLMANCRYIRQAPTEKQMTFLANDAEEVLFGGAAGPGKSSALLMASLMYADTPGYNALILRRSFADLSQPGAIMDRAKEWLAGTPARWNQTHKRFVFPSGATLTFGYLKNAGSHLQYQGAEFQFVGFDELTQFESYQYRYLFSRLRRLKGQEHIPLRMRAASNPGGPGHDWVKRRFIDRKRPGRCFIPARFVDNPYLDKDEYLKFLSRLDPVTRAQLEKGDWYVSKAGLIYPEFELCRVEPAEVPWGRLRRCAEWHGGIDWGWNNPFAAVHAVYDDDADVIWCHWLRYKRFMTVAQHAARLPRDEKLTEWLNAGLPEGEPPIPPIQTTWWADPSRPENVRDLLHADFYCAPALNDVQAGIDTVRERIVTGRLKVVSTLAPLFTEAGMYRDENDLSQSDEDDEDGPDDGPAAVQYQGIVPEDDAAAESYDVVADTASEEPDSKYDHSLDALRYLCMGVAKHHGQRWAERLSGYDHAAPDEDAAQHEGNFGRGGFEGRSDEDDEDYSRPPRRAEPARRPPPKPRDDPQPRRPPITSDYWWGNG